MAQQVNRRRLWLALVVAVGGVALGFALPSLIFRQLGLGLILGVLAGVAIVLALFLALLLYGDEA